MSRVRILRAFLKQRLTVDTEEISEVFDRRISEYEEELCRLKEENERRQKLLEAVLNPEVPFQTPDVRLLTGTEEHQGWSPGLGQDDPGPLHIKEEPEELWTSEEDQGLVLRTLVKQRRPAAAEHIYELFDRTIAEYKEEICRSTDENKRQQKLLDAVFKPKVLLHRAGCPVDVQRLAGNSKVSKGQVQENPESLPIKEEQEEVMIKQEDEAETPYTPVPVKTEEDEAKPPPSHFYQRRTEDGTDGSELCRGPEPDRSLDPRFQTDSDDETTDSSDTEVSDEPESGSCHHTAGKPFRCAVCQRRFRYKNNVKRHMKTHTGEKPFACSVCGTKFARKSHLHDHHTARHSGVKPFTCSLCKKQFGCANNYKKHMRRHTQEKRPPSYVSAEGRPMKHKCAECGKTFGSGSILKRHLKVHTGEKPFRCSECGQSFARNAHLINHMIRHTGEKPHSCSVCKKTFTRKDYVKVHMNIHTREKKGKKTLAEENPLFR